MNDFQTFQLPHQHIGKQCRIYHTVGSTNDVATLFLESIDHHGMVLSARQQQAGRGQYGRTWQSLPDQGVWLSVVLFPNAHLCRPALLTAWAALAVVNTVRTYTGLSAQIKWPNDVFVHGKKVAGILLEATPRTDFHHPLAVICGIGLNVQQKQEQFDAAGLTQATSFHLLEPENEYSVDQVRITLIENLDQLYQQLEREEGQLLDSWIEAIGLMHQKVKVEQSDGSIVPGILRHIDFEQIRCECAGHLRTFPTGQVKHLWRE